MFGSRKSKEQIIKEGSHVEKSEFDTWTWAEKAEWWENAKKNRTIGGDKKKEDNNSGGGWF